MVEFKKIKLLLAGGSKKDGKTSVGRIIRCIDLQKK